MVCTKEWLHSCRELQKYTPFFQGIPCGPSLAIQYSLYGSALATVMQPKSTIDKSICYSGTLILLLPISFWYSNIKSPSWILFFSLSTNLRDNQEFLLQERPSFALAVPVTSLHACCHTFGPPRSGSSPFVARSTQAPCRSARISMRAQKAPFHMKQTWRISHLCSVASQSNHTEFHAWKLF